MISHWSRLFLLLVIVFSACNQPEVVPVTSAKGPYQVQVPDSILNQTGNTASLKKWIEDQSMVDADKADRIGALLSQSSAQQVLSLDPFAKQLFELAQKESSRDIKCQYYTVLAQYYLKTWRYQQAFNMAKMAMNCSSLGGNPHQFGKNKLLLAKVLLAQGQKLKAYKTILEVQFQAYQHQDKQLLFEANGEISRFYYLIREFNQAVSIKEKQFRAYGELPDKDSITFYSLGLEYMDMLFQQGNSVKAQYWFNRIEAYASQQANQALLSDARKIYRSWLLKNGNLSALYFYYSKANPQALTEAAVQDSSLYFRLKAYMALYQKENQLAVSYFSLAEKSLINRPYNDTLSLSHFYRRYAEVLLVSNQNDQAMKMLLKSYQFAQASDFIPYRIEIAHLLDSLYASKREFQIAWNFAKQKEELQNRYQNTVKRTEILLLEIQNSDRLHELALKQAEDAQEKRHKLEYYAIVILIILCFLILILFGIFKVHRFAIKAAGFISFIFFFEFIILLADTYIHHLTHGAPLKIIAIKIVLIAILLPLHHSIEEKVVHYLIEHRLMLYSRLRTRTQLLIERLLKILRIRKSVNGVNKD